MGASNPPSDSTMRLCNALLAANLVAMFCLFNYLNYMQASQSVDPLQSAHTASLRGPENIAGFDLVTTLATEQPGSSRTLETVVNRPLPAVGQGHRDFFALASMTNTDKVMGQNGLEKCLLDPKKCHEAGATNPFCRVFGHFYHTMYQRWLGPFSSDNAPPFQFLEIGYYHGDGFETYMEYLPNAEAHSMEISCLPPGPRAEGKWPASYGNFAAKHRDYNKLREADRLHCGSAAEVDWLLDQWQNHMGPMKRPDAPPLKVVIDDGSHKASNMAQTVFFWLPRIQPGGFLVVEDVQPLGKANAFRTQFLPQMMADLHFCGSTPKNNAPREEACFPQLQRFFKAIHCEMHICVFERSDSPAEEPSLEDSTMPPGALDSSTCAALQTK